MSERKERSFQFGFNRSLRVEGGDMRISSNGGAMLMRELDEDLGFIDALAEELHDSRQGGFCKYKFAELLRTRLLLIALGYPDQDDADRLRHDPAIAAAACAWPGQGAIDFALPSQPTLSRLGATLSTHDNRRALLYAPLELAIAAHPLRRKHRHRYLTLDVDSTNLQTHGEQQGANYNGHYGHTCYHPLMASIYETGDLCGAWLRKGNASSARGAAEFVLPIVERVEGTIGQVADVRGDAAFANPRLMNALEARGVRYVFRIKSNPRLDELAKPFLKRPPGRPPHEVREWHHELEYQAESWERPRRVVLTVIDDPGERFLGEPQLRHFFLVTTHDAESMPAEALLEHYRKRGTFESWLGEFKNELMPRLSSSRRLENHATLSLFALAFQWMHLARALSDEAERRNRGTRLGTFRSRMLKVAARFVRSARRLQVRLPSDAFALWSSFMSLLTRRVARATPT